MLDRVGHVAFTFGVLRRAIVGEGRVVVRGGGPRVGL